MKKHIKAATLSLLLAALFTSLAVIGYALETTVVNAGDTNADGAVNESDAQCLIEYLAATPKPKAVNAAYDANADGIVNNCDAVLLMQYLAGADVEIFADPNAGWTKDYR